MTVARIDFYSDALRRKVNFHVFLPDGVRGEHAYFSEPMKTLVLLHGYTGCGSDWLGFSELSELVNQYHLCVVCPDGENSFYLDGKETGRNYATYVGKELIAYVRKMFRVSVSKEDTYVGGLSMGGFGAIHTGLMFADTFSKIFAWSSGMIIHEYEKMEEGQESVANFDYYHMVFGDQKRVAQSVNNPEFLVAKLKEEHKEIPKVFMACGSEDFLVETNRMFKDILLQQGVEITYRESPGGHTMKFWSEYLRPSVEWLVNN